MRSQTTCFQIKATIIHFVLNVRFLTAITRNVGCWKTFGPSLRNFATYFQKSNTPDLRLLLHILEALKFQCVKSVFYHKDFSMFLLPQINGKVVEFERKYQVKCEQGKPLFDLYWEPEIKNLVFYHYRLGLVVELKESWKVCQFFQTVFVTSKEIELIGLWNLNMRLRQSNLIEANIVLVEVFAMFGCLTQSPRFDKIRWSLEDKMLTLKITTQRQRKISSASKSPLNISPLVYWWNMHFPAQDVGRATSCLIHPQYLVSPILECFCIYEIPSELSPPVYNDSKKPFELLTISL